MDSGRQAIEEQLAFLSRHVEQQDRVILDLTREVAKLVDRLTEIETIVRRTGCNEVEIRPADERPPHW